MKLFAIFTFLACFVAVNAKEMNISKVLRNQMEQLVHEYNSQKLDKHHHLKDKAVLDAIKKDLMNQFQKMAHETEHKLGKRAKAMKAGAKRRKRNRKMRA